MDILKIIEKKSKKIPLNENEIIFFVNEFLIDGLVKDYQAAALLMAIKINGFNDDEIFHYTNALINSGKILSKKSEFFDKHSTGGIGDKTTIVLLPILGAMGVKIWKISGRGLGFTGGTIDKLESIGINTDLKITEAKKIIDEIGFVVTKQTKDFTPADEKIYLLRDVTSTIDSIPLIASSIMAKKIATGAKNILIDLKIGAGAFIKTIENANELVEKMKLIAKKFDRNLFVLFSNMNEPLGFTIGNKIEIIEAIEFLKNNNLSEKNFSILVKKIATEIYSKSENVSLKIATNAYENVLQSGKAYEFQKKWFEKCGVINYDNAIKFSPDFVIKFRAMDEGYINFRNVEKIGNLLVEMKAGRKFKDDKIDYYSGIKFFKKSNDYVKKDEILFEVFSSNEISESLVSEFNNIFFYSKELNKENFDIIIGEVRW